MKHLFTLLLVAVTVQLFSQPNFRFADSTAVWNELETQWGWSYSINNHEFKAVGDTLVGGHQYQVVKETGGSYKVLLRTDSLQRVYRFASNDTAELLIYDFSQLTGNTFMIQGTWQNTYARVDSVNTIQLDRPRKRMYLSTGSSLNSYWSSDIWVEGIGSLITNLWSPGIGEQALDGPEFTLLCFSEKGSQVYQNSFYNTCVYTSVTEVPVNPVSVTYNNRTITIGSGADLSATSFSLYDLNGRLLLQKTLTGTSSIISAAGISSGMYLYTITGTGGKIYSGKLVAY